MFTDKSTDSLSLSDHTRELRIFDPMGRVRDVQYLLAFRSELMSPEQLGYILLLYSVERLPSYVPPHVRTTFKPLQPGLELCLPPDNTLLCEQIPDRIDRAAWKALCLETVLMSKQRTLEDLQSDATAVLADLTYLQDTERVNLGVAVVKRVVIEAHELPWDIVTEWFGLLYYHDTPPDKLQSLFQATASILDRHETALCLAISVLSLQGWVDRQIRPRCREILWTEYVRQCGNNEAAPILIKVLYSICSADEDRWVLWHTMLDEQLDFRRTFSNLGLEKAGDKIERIVKGKALRWLKELV